jgi:hypothetical protein
MSPLIPLSEAIMPHAIIRGANGRRHEVNFDDGPVRVEIHPSEETVEISMWRLTSRRSPRGVGASPFSTFPVTCSAKPPPQPRDGPRILVLQLDVISDFGTYAGPEFGAFIPKADGCPRTNPTPFQNGAPELMERSTAP